MDLKKWVVAARLRTLPLSSSGVILGIVLGVCELYKKSPMIFQNNMMIIFLSSFFIILTAVLLQILSNFANDYGDACSGVDNQERVGPKRGLVTGEMTLKQLKYGIITVVFFTICSGLIALGLSFYNDIEALLAFTMLGALAIVAAITYTIGLVYGYKGLGDISVFIFFGLVSVLGSEYMIAKEISTLGWILGSLSGFMSILVLNVNNLRDYKSDKESGKNSLVVKFGLKGGKIYHLVLLLAVVCLSVQAVSMLFKLSAFIALVSLIPIVRASTFCIKPENIDATLDPMLKKTSIGASIVNLTFAIVIAISVI